MQAADWLATQIHSQRAALFPWVPVCLGCGIGLYFHLKWEPAIGLLWGLAGLAILCFAGGLIWRHRAMAVVLFACGLVVAGLVLAAYRAHSVSAPVLGWRYYGPIEGRVVAMDRSSSDALRITLDQVDLGRISPRRTPARVRISLHGDAVGQDAPIPGARVMTTGHLSPPSGPVEPGGFDFQRHAWFLRLGAVGYTRVPVLAASAPSRGDWRAHVFAARMAVSGFVQDRLGGDVGGFAAAVTAGDRSGMGQGALKDLRASNLAHLLAISGLHMGLLTGFVFALLRMSLAAIPRLALYAPIRSISAGIALVSGAGYLLLSGGIVATERAFVMAAVALCAVMLNRRVMSLRTVAIAALVVLALRPEALLGPGFQMSFAATTALVVAFNALRYAPWSLPPFLKPVSAVIVSSAVAGIATAPFAAAHFNALAHYGLLANVLSVPVMGALVVPAAVLAACLTPFGLAGVGLWLMGWGLAWILRVAEFVAALPGARSMVHSPGPGVLPLFVIGALLVLVWRGRARWAGLPIAVCALVLWFQAERPDVLIADSGGIVGIMTDQGRALSKARGSGFVAQNWLENDGDKGGQSGAYERWERTWATPVTRQAFAQVDGLQIVHITGKKAAAAPPDCEKGVLVSNAPVEMQPICTLYSPDKLRHTGSVALYWVAGGFETKTARQMAGDRLWSSWPEPDQ